MGPLSKDGCKEKAVDSALLILWAIPYFFLHAERLLGAHSFAGSERISGIGPSLRPLLHSETNPCVFKEAFVY